jgi:hypothetical protein
MNYQDAVTEARMLDKRSEEDQWRLAQLTYEQVETGISRRQWERDTGMSHKRVQVLYRVWERWGGAAAPDRPEFGEAYAEFGDPARMAEGGQEIGRAKSTVRNLPPEEKAAVIREALEDDEVATRVMRDPATRGGISRARQRVWSEQEQGVTARQQASSAQRDAAFTAEHFEVGNHLRLSRFHAAEAARRLQDIDDRDEAMVRQFQGDAQEVRDALDWFEVVVRGGKVDDEALAKFLEGGGV